MSFSSISRARALALAVAALALGAPHAGATQTPAHNCFTTNYTGTTVTAYGATFQTRAHVNSFNPAYAADCGANAGTVTYNNPQGTGAGSGKCITLVTTHAPATGYGYTPFCGSDDPLTTAQWQAANSNGGVVNQIPVAVGAVAIVYNDGAATCPSPLVLTKQQLSDIFQGNANGDNFNDLGCTGSQAIERVVRDAVSGTTCILKSYLAARNDSFWGSYNSSNGGCGSTNWPTGTTVTMKNGNSGIVNYIATPTAGTIGYTDLATNLDSATPNLMANVKTVVQEQAGGSESPVVASTGAANCQGQSPIPPSTSSPGWDTVSLVDGPAGYPICGFTYAFMFTNTQTAFGAGHITPAQQQVAVDYLISAVTTGQSTLAGDHYAPLPPHAQGVALAGLATKKASCLPPLNICT